jgi:hypothetical protein
MPHRKFATPKALIDYAEQKGLVYVWENGRRPRVPSPAPAFTKRRQLLSPNEYELVDVCTLSGERLMIRFLLLQLPVRVHRGNRGTNSEVPSGLD